MTKDKPKVAFYWCASCGGCEEAIVDLHEAILDVVEAVDIIMWPVALDFKYKDVEAMGDGSMTPSLSSVIRQYWTRMSPRPLPKTSSRISSRSKSWCRWR